MRAVCHAKLSTEKERKAHHKGDDQGNGQHSEQPKHEHSGGVFRGARQKHSRRSELFIAKGVDNEVSTSDLEMYLKSKGFTVEELQCVSHNDAKNKSFRLRVSANEFPKLFEAELWPNGVIVQKFRNARLYNQQN